MQAKGHESSHVSEAAIDAKWSHLRPFNRSLSINQSTFKLISLTEVRWNSLQLHILGFSGPGVWGFKVLGFIETQVRRQLGFSVIEFAELGS
jgi:hypothetical protein